MEPAEEAEEASGEKIEPDETETKAESECSQPRDIEYKPGQYLTANTSSPALSLTEPSEYLTGRVFHSMSRIVPKSYYARNFMP